MFKSITPMLGLMFASSVLVAQTPASFIIKQDTVTLKLETVKGLGPAGQSGLGAPDKEAYSADAPERKTFKLKNIPTNLTEVTEYCLPINTYQFYYQNYKQGIFTKSFITDYVSSARNQKLLSDTSKLSPKPIKSSVAFIIGLSQERKPVYIIDTDNDGDLMNDKVRPLDFLRGAGMIVTEAVDVSMNTFTNGHIAEYKLSVAISAYQGKNPTVLFPSFSYRKVMFNGQNYNICTSGLPFSPFITVLDDKPNFTEVSSEKRVTAGQFFKLGDSDFKLVSVDESKGEIVFTGKDLSGFKISDEPNTNNKTTRVKSKIRSTTLGYDAPLASGININKALKQRKISTASLKGKYIYIDFWGTYCIPCIEEIPYIKEAYKQIGREKFEVIGILDEPDAGIAQKLLKQHNVPWPNISLNSTTTNTSGYGVISSFPTSYLIGPNGKIVAANLRGNMLLAKLRSLIGK